MRRVWLRYLAASAAVLATVGLVSALALARRPGSDALPSMAPNLSALGLEYSPGARPDPIDREGFTVAGARVSGLAAKGKMLVAVGSVITSPARPDGGVDGPAAWWSDDDGATWTRTRLGGQGLLLSVAAQDGRFVAVGTSSPNPDATALVFTSTDGRTWREVPVDGPTVRLSAVVAGPGGPILVGSREGQEGPVPFAFFPAGKAWQGMEVRPGGQTVWGQVRGGCVHRGRVVLVGEAFDDRAVSRTLVLQSPDRGASWTAELVRRGVLDGGAGSAVGCTVVGRTLTLAGNVATAGGQRGFAISRSAAGDAWDEPILLPHLRESGQAASSASAVTAAGAKLVVVGSDASADPQGDGAVWWGGPVAASRLPGLEESVSQKGVDEITTVLAYRGILVIGANQSSRPVIVRSSPEVAVLHTTGSERTADWWRRYAAVEPCSLLDGSAVRELTGRSDLQAQPAPVVEGYVTCAWVDGSGRMVLSVELAPPERLARLRDAAFHDVGSAHSLSSRCSEGAYYPTFHTAAGKCGESAVAVSGVDEDHAARALDAVEGRMSRQ